MKHIVNISKQTVVLTTSDKEIVTLQPGGEVSLEISESHSIKTHVEAGRLEVLDGRNKKARESAAAKAAADAEGGS